MGVRIASDLADPRSEQKCLSFSLKIAACCNKVDKRSDSEPLWHSQTLSLTQLAIQTPKHQFMTTCVSINYYKLPLEKKLWLKFQHASPSTPLWSAGPFSNKHTLQGVQIVLINLSLFHSKQELLVSLTTLCTGSFSGVF